MQHIKLSKYHARQGMASLFRYIVLTGLAFVILYPFLIKLSLAVMDIRDLSDATVRFVPKTFTLENIKGAIRFLDYYPNLLYTVVFTTTISLVQVFFAMITAYGLACFRFPGRKILFGLVLFSLIVPPQSIILSLYFNFQSLSLLGKPLSLYLLAATGLGLKNGLLIFIFRQFFKGCPRELEESASIDGAGVIGTFVRIIMPSAIPIILTSYLFSIVWQWTDSFYTSIFIPDNTLLARRLQMLVSLIIRAERS
jgi:multiple sugar transport system permease protein